MSSSSSEEDENEERPVTNNELIMSGNIPEAKLSPFMHIFKIPEDNLVTLQRLHYEISKKLLTNDSTITYDSPFAHGRKVTYALIPQETSRSTNLHRSNMINNMINSNNTTNENKRDSFIHRILQMIDSKYNEEFFNYIIKKNLATRY